MSRRPSKKVGIEAKILYQMAPMGPRSSSGWISLETGPNHPSGSRQTWRSLMGACVVCLCVCESNNSEKEAYNCARTCMESVK